MSNSHTYDLLRLASNGLVSGADCGSTMERKLTMSPKPSSVSKASRAACLRAGRACIECYRELIKLNATKLRPNCKFVNSALGDR